MLPMKLELLAVEIDGAVHFVVSPSRARYYLREIFYNIKIYWTFGLTIIIITTCHWIKYITSTLKGIYLSSSSAIKIVK